MDFNQLHFAYPVWFWLGLIIPFVWVIFYLFYKVFCPTQQLEKFIDKHLLPYLLINKTEKKRSPWKTVLLWSIVWACLTVALAGPRWNLREIETFSKDQTLVILLDLSNSMNATDIKPTRLTRAKQKIEDILNLSSGVKIGLIAFAADPHMIAPITDDKETLRHLLPALDTDLIFVQGSRLSSALDMASAMLESEPGSNKAVLVISDGGFEDASAIIVAKKLSEKGIAIHAMGIGTPEGIALSDGKKSNVHSKLEKDRLKEISTVGNGHYLEGRYSDQQELAILSELKKRAETQVNIGKKNQFWDEGFYLAILPILPIFLWWFQRGSLFAIAFLILMPSFELTAANFSDYFKNSEELGKQAFEQSDYNAAVDAFQDPYRKGVTCYKAQNFAEAEKLFRQSNRPEVACSAAFNLGNSLVMQNKLKEAITAYEEVLKQWPDHSKAKENLELVKKMLEQEQNSSDPQDNQNDEEKSEDGKNEGENQGSHDPKEDDQEEKDNNSEEDSQKDQQQQQKEEEQQQNDSNREEDTQDKPKEEKSQEQKEDRSAMASKSQEDLDADLWLNQISNDPKNFLKNKFHIESKKNGTKEGIDPW